MKNVSKKSTEIEKLQAQVNTLLEENMFLRGLCEELQGKRNKTEVELAYARNFTVPPGEEKPKRITEVFKDLGDALDTLEKMKLIPPCAPLDDPLEKNGKMIPPVSDMTK